MPDSFIDSSHWKKNFQSMNRKYLQPDGMNLRKIRRELPEGEIIQARLIGNLLLKYPLGISDSWYMNRIKHMIETGEIKVVKEADEIFRRSIRKEQ